MAKVVAGDVDNIDAYFMRTFLTELRSDLVHMLFGQVKTIPRKSGSKVARFRRWNKMAAATTALTEGTEPTVGSITNTDITATIAQYGDWLQFTDLADFTTMDPLATVFTQEQGAQASLTLDTLTRDVLVAGTSVTYGGTATSRVTVAAGDVIDLADVEAAYLVLAGNDAKPIKQFVNPSTNVATEAVNPSYVGICGYDIGLQISKLTGFIDVKDYGSRENIMPGELGSLNKIRFVQTTNAKVFTGEGAAGIDVYPVLFLGKDAYGLISVGGESMHLYRDAPGEHGSDILRQNSAMGWKTAFVAKILDNRALHRLEVALT